ncbi:uncharacterized abhydrolase domain-containing protein DDB_G0269086-like isoform X14 [Eriocheir sinensis]|uniref:uncharacterized abhydrolase domain-containing protein DDB_G0269086-like isoform X14 n=1 Tax=Eriocheir sinensis TaxID=95602 RepID=UPI0021C84B43|nr:uncharacterized abhydrolase domain-containing protein DDB_G0269086-like isoform X14 [Eriocheir sinensis]
MVLEPEHRASMRRQAQPYRSRSLSPRAPYLWQDREVDVPSVERRSRKGWYRVDYGPEKSDEVLYLPSFKDRMNFLERSVNRATSEPRIRATSVPPLTVDVRRTKALSIDPIVRDPYRWRTWPFYYHNYRRPYSNYYDMYWPTLGPYSGRIWRLPWYRYPSSPLTTSTAWRYVSSPYSSYSATTTIGPDCTEVMEERRSLSPPPVHYRPPASTQLILNRVALGRSSVPPRSYPPARYTPRYYPSYLDYDYGYGGYYYPPYYPRMSRYDYLDDLDSPYLSSSYRPRALDLDTDYREKKTTTPSRVITTYRTYTPGAALSTASTTTTTTPRTRFEDEEDSKDLVPKLDHRPSSRVRSHAYSRVEDLKGESEADKRLAQLERRYPKLSEPQMLQDHVENMRFRLKSLAHSLDPTGPVPEIVIPERSTTTKKSTAVALPEEKKSYSSSAMEFSELPKLASRRQRYYPEDDHMKDNLRIQCLSHYKTTRTAAETQLRRLMPETSYRSSKFSASKWEEPDTVFGGPSDKKPYSKVETGSSFFSTYGYTNRKKDYVAEKVRDYYYFGDSEKDSGRVRFDSSARKAITDGTSEEVSEEKKERRKKKKSKERDVPEASTDAASASATAAADHSTSEADPVSATTDEAGTGDAAEDEKERKRQEKKKRKAEREAAAKAAMEAELAALAAAEAELARLEAESNKKEAPAPAPAPAEAAPAEAAPAEVKRTDAIPEPATSTAEEARLGAQEDTEAAAEYTATTTDAADTTTHDPETAAVADIAAHTEADDHADAPPPARFDEEAE